MFCCAGLDNLYYLTNFKIFEICIDREEFKGKKVFAEYSSFSVGNECSGFVLKVFGFMTKFSSETCR